jgi:class 3 adenylate cyclase
VSGRPETKYAWNGDVSLAYQVLGDGPIDLVYLQGYASHVDLNWDSPALSRFLRGLAAHAHLIITDRRGWGASDRFSPFDVAPIETMVDDLLVVMDAVGSERAVIFATQECSINGSLFAATYPERTRALILCDPYSTYDEQAMFVTPDRAPSDDEEWERQIQGVRDMWGTQAWVAHWTDAREREWFPVYSRSAIPPGGLIAEMRRFRYTDPRAIYPTIHVPTLVLGTTGGDSINSEGNARYLASVISGARLVQHDIVSRPWMHWYVRREPILGEVARFLDEIREEDAILDRVLATVMFTDIVGSSAKSAELGDRQWHGVLERHHATVRAAIARFRGQEMDTAGDGFFAAFDGPGRAIRCAQAIAGSVRSLGLEVRAGIHTGECERINGKLGGLAVNVGARIAALAGPSEILTSETVRNLVAGSGIRLAKHGRERLKGIPGDWTLYSVADPR